LQQAKVTAHKGVLICALLLYVYFYWVLLISAVSLHSFL